MTDFNARLFGGFDTFEEALVEWTRWRGLPLPTWNDWRRDVALIAALYQDSPAFAGQGGGQATILYSQLRLRVNEAVWGDDWRNVPVLTTGAVVGPAGLIGAGGSPFGRAPVMEPGTEIATRDEYLTVVDEEEELHVGAGMPTPGDGRVGGDAGLAETGGSSVTVTLGNRRWPKPAGRPDKEDTCECQYRPCHPEPA